MLKGAGLPAPESEVLCLAREQVHYRQQKCKLLTPSFVCKSSVSLSMQYIVPLLRQVASGGKDFVLSRHLSSTGLRAPSHFM